MKNPVWAFPFLLALSVKAQIIQSLPMDLILPLKISTFMSDRQTRIAEENHQIILSSSAMLTADINDQERKNIQVTLEKLNHRKILRNEIQKMLEQHQIQKEGLHNQGLNTDQIRQQEAALASKEYSILAAEILLEHTEVIPSGRPFQICTPENLSNNPEDIFNLIVIDADRLLKTLVRRPLIENKSLSSEKPFSYSITFSSEEMTVRQDTGKKWNCAYLQKNLASFTSADNAKDPTKSVIIQSFQQELKEFAKKPSETNRQYCNRPEGLAALEKLLEKQVQIFNSSDRNNPEKIQLHVLTELEESSNSSNPNLRCLKIQKIGGNL